MKKIIIFTFLLIAIIITIIGLNSFKTDNKATGGSAIIWASIGDASYLNPILASDSASGDINSLVFNGLVKYDKDLNLVGELAESYEVSDDKLEIIFTLKKGIKWHDGEEFSSDDVVYTFNVIKDTATRTPYSSRFDRVVSLEAPDKYTIIVKYSEPFAPALESWGMGILPAHLYRGSDINTNPHNRKPIGTGPYIFKNWKTDDRIILTANENYFEGKPGLDKVIYRIIPDISVQFMELKRGGVDWMGPSPDQWNNEVVKEEFKNRFQMYRYPSFSYSYMGFNLNSRYFRDKKVRKAISYAIDKQSIIDSVLQGLGSPAHCPYPPNSWAYDPSIKDYGYDVEKAKELLKEAGWILNPKTSVLEKEGQPFAFTLMTNQGNTKRKLTCEIIQSQLAMVGIEVKVRIQEWSSFIHQYVDKRQFDAIVIGWSLSIDPDQYSIWHSSQQGEGKYNFVGFQNSEVDRLLLEGRKTFDVEKRKKIYFRIQKILADEQPYLFLFFSDTLQVLDNRIKNINVEKSGIAHNFIEWNVPEELRRQ